MKKEYWLIAFIIFFIAHLTGIQLHNESIQFFTKPTLIPVLAGFFLFQTNSIANSLKKWILFALFFSWGGDVLLMFVSKNELFFLLGLASFLLAHIFYIVFFNQVRVRENIKSNPWILLIVVVYSAALTTWLSPYLGKMKLPVRIYGIVISFMFLLALNVFAIKNKAVGKWMMFGALLFVISDSVLAINKFYEPFDAAGIIIMLTYGLAQLFIVRGAAEYIISSKSQLVLVSE